MDGDRTKTEQAPCRPTPARRQRVGRRVGLVVGIAVCLATGSGCGGDGATPPPPPPPPSQDLVCPSSGVPLCGNANAAVTVRDAVSDAITRSAPALENATARAALLTNLGQLEANLAAGVMNITKARIAYTATRAAIPGASSQGPDAPDLGAIELLLDHIAPLIGS